MLTSIGRRSRREDLVGLLLDCHERIRAFARLAVELANQELAEGDVRDGCGRCEKYFAEALPLHVADEEESLLPRLRGLSPELDRALEEMHSQHSIHEPIVAEVLDALRALAATPLDAAARARLGAIAPRLSDELEAHLAAEERIIFPAVETLLPATIQAEIIAELRGRRAGAR